MVKGMLPLEVMVNVREAGVEVMARFCGAGSEPPAVAPNARDCGVTCKVGTGWKNVISGFAVAVLTKRGIGTVAGEAVVTVLTGAWLMSAVMVGGCNSDKLAG